MFAVEVQVADNPPTRCFLTGCGDYTIGRPGKVDPNRTGWPDVVVEDKSISRVHGILSVQGRSQAGSASKEHALMLQDKSRYGTCVNGNKLAGGEPYTLAVGDVIQLAPKARITVGTQPVVLLVAPEEEPLHALSEQCGVPWTSSPLPDVTHMVHDSERPIGAAHLAGLVQGKPLLAASWLEEVSSKRVWEGSLPSFEQHALQRVTLPTAPQRCLAVSELATTLAAGRAMLAGTALRFLPGCQDPALRQCVELLGGTVLGTAAEAAGDGSSVAAVTVVATRDAAGGQADSAACITDQQLLECLLTGDLSALRARAERAAAAAAVGAGGEESDADTDMTQADDSSPPMAWNVFSSALPPPAGTQAAPPQAAAAAPASPEAGAATRGGAQAGQAATQDGWVHAIKRPIEGALPEPDATKRGREQQQEQQETPGRASKRRKTGAAATGKATADKGAAAGGRSAAGASASAPDQNQAAKPDQGLDFAAKGQLNTAAAASAAAASLLAAVERPWAPLHGRTPHASGGAGDDNASRPSARQAHSPAATEAVPAGATQQQQRAAAATPQATAPVTANSDQQVIEFVPLVAADASPGAAAPEAGVASAGTAGAGATPHAWADGGALNFKAFRKQHQQAAVGVQQEGSRNSGVVPVVLTDQFRSTEETDAYLREEEQRLRRRRAAEELFNMQVAPRKR